MFDVTQGAPNVSDIRQRLSERIVASIPDADTGRDSALGQLLDIVAEEAALSYEYAEHAYLQSKLATATGAALDDIAAIVDVQRRRGTTPLYSAFVIGTPPDVVKFDSGSSGNITKRSAGRFGYLRSSIRYPGAATSESALMSSKNLVARGDILIHRDTVYGAPVALEAIGATDLSYVEFDTRPSDVTGDGWQVVAPNPPMRSSGNVDDESDDSLRARVRPQTQLIGGTIAAIEAALVAEGMPATVGEWLAPSLSPQGQPPGTITIAFHAPVNAAKAGAAIKRARPAGIPTWAPETGGYFDADSGERWIVSATRMVDVTIQAVTVVPGQVRNNLAADAIIRREVVKPGVIYGQKIAAVLANELPWLLDCTILLNGSPSLPADARTSEVGTITWTS
jgi:uncharacterized phage protein gp47/JayE|nr:MAG TPA: Baseplate J like protein [Caudoviricetes sp.]